MQSNIKKHTISYSGGLNRDMSVNNYKSTCYFDATNLRPVVSDSIGLTSGSMVSVSGNSCAFILPDNAVAVGSAFLGDYLILIAHTDESVTYPDRIYRIPIEDIKKASAIEVHNVYYWSPSAGEGDYLVYMNDLNLSSDVDVHVIANYENDFIQKIYFIDGVNPLRHLNIVYDAQTNDLTSLDPTLLDMIPTTFYASYSIKEQPGGHLKAGRVQYSYQLYSVSGSETMFAPPSKLYNITSHDLSSSMSVFDFVGDDIETEVNKSLRVTLSFDDYNVTDVFNRIRIIALDYEKYDSVPGVRIVYEGGLNSSTFSFVDDGDSIGELVFSEVRDIKYDMIPNAFEVKGGYLFIANVTREFFDIDTLVEELTEGEKTFFDSRAYRWRYDDGSGSIHRNRKLSTYEDIENDIYIDPYTTTITVGGTNNLPLDINVIEAVNCQFEQNYWRCSFYIGCEVDAFNNGYTFDSIYGILNKWYINGYAYNNHTGEWMWMELYVGDAIFSYDPDSDLLTVIGSSYAFSSYEAYVEFWEHPEYFTGFGSTDLIYMYNYHSVSEDSFIECVLNKGGVGVSPMFVLDANDPNYEDVPEDHDCINVYNNLENDFNIECAYKYKYGDYSSTPPTYADLGGTGPYIEFEFVTEEINAGEVTSWGSIPILAPSDDYNGYANPETVYSFTGYQRDEIYRFGIVFYDLKGRPSYAKWICDIRMPDMGEDICGIGSNAFDLTVTDSSDPDGIFKCKALGIKFTLNLDKINTDYPGLLNYISGYQIVRCERTPENCTIKASGVIQPTIKPKYTDPPKLEDAYYSCYHFIGAYDYDLSYFPIISGISGSNSNNYMGKTVLDFLSPEIAFNKSLKFSEGDFLEVCGYYKDIQTYVKNDYCDEYAVSATNIVGYHVDDSNIDDFVKNIEQCLILGPKPKYFPTYTIGLVGAFSVVARGFDGERPSTSNPEIAYKGTSLIVKVEDSFGSSIVLSGMATDDKKAMYGRYRRNLGYSIYGGCTYQERSFNEYIGCSEFVSVSPSDTSSSVDVWGGDVYISPFNYLRLFVDSNNEYTNNSGQMIISIPVESRINLNCRLDKFIKYLTSGYIKSTISNYYLAEYSSIGISQYPSYYPDEIGNLYRYNSAYSSEDKFRVFVSRPLDYQNTSHNPTIVFSSEKKFNGEYSDSWLKFKPNNYLELEGKYGGIVKLLNFQNRLFSFQPDGIALISSLEREVIPSFDSVLTDAQLVLGSGGVLDRYDYVSKTVGCSSHRSVIGTDSGIYFYDSRRSSIYRILEGIESLSDSKGLKSFMKLKSYSDMLVMHDGENREVIFVPYGYGYTNEKSIVYNGFLDHFHGFYTLYDTSGNSVIRSISKGSILLSSVDGNSFYLHNIDKTYVNFFNTQHDIYLALIVNPVDDNVVTFHIMEWITNIIDYSDSQPVNKEDLTFTSVRVSNSYQDSYDIGLISTTDGSIINNYLNKRLRVWRLNVFRDALEKGKEARFRDSFIKAEFTLDDNFTSYRVVIHPISFSWSPTIL